MRYNPIIMLVCVAIALAGVGLATSVAIDSKVNRRGARLFTVDEVGTRTNRQLRTEENDEERVIPGLDKVTVSLKTGSEKVADAVRLRNWLRKDKSVDDVWEKLKLNERLDDVIANPKLKTLSKYVDMFNKKYPDEPVSLVGTLSLRYGEDAVAMAVIPAKRVESTREIAAQLHYQQLKGWFTSGNTADDVFNKLKVSEDGPSFAMSPKLGILGEYIQFFNVKKPQERTNIFRVLRNGFGGDENFAVIVSKAMETPSLQTIAAKFQDALFKRWYKTKVEPRNVLTRVFNIDEKDLASVGAREKSIVDKYKAYYDEELGLDQIPSIVNPRRT